MSESEANAASTQKFFGRVLIIAGSDPSGGAGVQADIKTVTVLGGYAMSAITALTVQNTLGVQAIHPISAEVVTAQARAALDDIGADAIKTPSLLTREDPSGPWVSNSGAALFGATAATAVATDVETPSARRWGRSAGASPGSG